MNEKVYKIEKSREELIEYSNEIINICKPLNHAERLVVLSALLDGLIETFKQMNIQIAGWNHE